MGFLVGNVVTLATTILLPLNTLYLCFFETDHLIGDKVMFSILGFQFGSQFIVVWVLGLFAGLIEVARGSKGNE